MIIIRLEDLKSNRDEAIVYETTCVLFIDFVIK